MEQETKNIQTEKQVYTKSPYLSHSRLSTYADCSLRYYFNYEEKVPVIKTSLAREYGDAVHVGLEKFHKELKNEKGTPEIDFLVDAFDQSWENKVMFSEIEISKTEFDSYRQMGITSLAQYYKENKGTEWFKPPIGVEYSFEIPIIDFSTGEIITEEFNLFGLIDLILQYENTLYLIDHKTSRFKYSDYTISNSMQLTLYYYALVYLIMTDQIKNPDNLKLGVGFNLFQKTKSPKLFKYLTTRDDGDLARLIETIKRVIDGMQKKIYIPNFGSQRCEYCDFREPCTMWGKYGDEWKKKYIAKQGKVMELEDED